jgi:hypothetical protein
MGLDGVSALKASNNVFATTLKQQANLFAQFGPSGMQVLETGARVGIDRAGDKVAETTSGFFDWPGADLAPSAAGPSWNAPPTPVIAPVFASPSEGSGAMQNFVASNAGSIPVCASN